MWFNQQQQSFSLALITGASSGIGKALSFLLADQGVNLIIHGRDRARLESVLEELRHKVEVTILHGDLELEIEQQKLIDHIHARKPDLVINSAGFGLYGEALSYETKEQLEILQLDGAAVLRLTLEAARTMISAEIPGVIMNISSVAAFPVYPCFAVYSATKAFVNQFSRAFDEETRPHGVRVLAACPGAVSTEFFSRAGGAQFSLSGRSKVMDVDFAAREIWKQIIKRKKIHVFNYFYRLLLLFAQLLPESITSYLLRKRIERLHDPKPIIKLPLSDSLNPK